MARPAIRARHDLRQHFRLYSLGFAAGFSAQGKKIIAAHSDFGEALFAAAFFFAEIQSWFFMEGHTSFMALLRTFVCKDARSFAYLKVEKPSLGCYQEAKFPSKKPLQSTFFAARLSMSPWNNLVLWFLELSAFSSFLSLSHSHHFFLLTTTRPDQPRRVSFKLGLRKRKVVNTSHCAMFMHDKRAQISIYHPR